jgi:hypothetical protein
VLGVENSGELVPDERHLSLLFHQFWKEFLGSAFCFFLLDALHHPLACNGATHRHHFFRLERVIPKLQRAHPAELCH